MSGLNGAEGRGVFKEMCVGGTGGFIPLWAAKIINHSNAYFYTQRKDLRVQILPRNLMSCFDTKEIMWVVISDYDICTFTRKKRDMYFMLVVLLQTLYFEPEFPV
jgi:hypothetical protein